MGSEEKRTTAEPISIVTYLIVAVVAASAGFGAVYVNYALYGNNAPAPAARGSGDEAEMASPPASAEATGIAALARGKMSTFVAKDEPEELPEVSFQDGTGAQRSLADWRGKVVLLNLWATWCAPCREEMPALDELQGQLGGEDFEVVAASIDKGDADKPREFLEDHGIGNLALYHDPSGRLGNTLKAYGMPTTLLIDRQGREIGRLVGPAEWDSQDAINLVKAAIENQG
jgi:thiol-disulfide isomerase/thioredoxin